MNRCWLNLLAVTFALCASRAHAQRVQPASYQAPPTPREFRAAWVATVGNSTWPTRRDLSVAEQQKEVIDILDRAFALRLNTIIFQVRTQCDALYDSKLEPWSEFLTGAEGKPPEPFYDPLALWIEESHKRGLELHAWFNPYRAKSGSAKGDRAPTHVSKTNPAIVRTYGTQLWLDPGDPATIEYSLSVFLDVVKRYDVDGVHIDDYFYPYKVAEGDAPATEPADEDDVAPATGPVTAPATRGRARTSEANRPRRRMLDFPDDATWAKFQATGGKLSRNDWRRQNVNILIQKLYTAIKAEKRYVKFGVSPFGIWRPGNPKGITGLDAFEQLYADSRTWFSKGWCDYFTPQLYWPDGGAQSFSALFNWWSAQNESKRHLWPGIAVGGRRNGPAETLKQITITRRHPNSGVVHWSARSLMHNEKLCEALAAGPYAEQAIVPASIWLDNAPPPKPDAAATRDSDGSGFITVTPGAGEATSLWAIKARYGTKWKFLARPGTETQITLPADSKAGIINSLNITAVDRCGNESERLAIGLTLAR